MTPSMRHRVAVEALRHAVHNPNEVGPWLHIDLFDDEVHRGAFQALLDADTDAGALAASPPEVADLLARLLVAAPKTLPLDTVAWLHHEAPHRITQRDPQEVLRDHLHNIEKEAQALLDHVKTARLELDL